MVEQIYSQQLQICLSMWTHFEKYALKINRVRKQQILKGCFVIDEKKLLTRSFSWRVSAETQVAICFKKGLLEKYHSVPNTFLQHIANEKDIFSKLNRYISKISLKYLKFYNREILFLLVLCNFNVYFKITWPSPLPRQNKNF